MLRELYQDFKFCLRTLFRRPSLAIAAAVAAMALGIGASVAIFSVVKTVLLQPLPYPGADRVVVVWNQFTKIGYPKVPLSPPELVDYRKRSTSLQAFAAVVTAKGNLTGNGAQPERVSYAAVSPSLFSILQARPALGRIPVEGEDRLDAPRLAVLSDGFWRRRFGADPGAVGRDMLVNGNKCIVIGVMPASFRYPEGIDLWMPIRLPAPDPMDRGNRYLRVLGRLKPGVDLRTAQSEMKGVGRQLQRDFPLFYPGDSGWGVNLTPFHEELTGDVRPALLILLGAVGLVLLIACANVSSLQLERTLARSREIAVRTALGEPRGRLIRRFITESLLVTLLGGVVGVVIAAFAVRAFSRIAPASIPRSYDISVDASVILLAAGLALVSGLMIGLVPAVQSSKLTLTEALKEGGEKSVGGRGRQRVRRVLVVVETALALVLVIGAGLLARTFSQLRRLDPGFNAENTLTLQIALPGTKYPDAQVNTFYQQLAEKVAALPGVRSAGVTNCLPLGDCSLSGSYWVEENMPAADSMPPEVDLGIITPDYFRAMGISLRAGRFFNSQDHMENRGGEGIVIVDEELARRNWPGQSPIGKRIKFNLSPDTPWRTVVGLVSHVKLAGLDSSSREQVYVPFSRLPSSDSFLVVRSDGDPSVLVGPIREVVKTLDTELPIFDVQTMSDRLVGSLALRQLSMSLLLSLAFFALFLAGVGLYSLITFSVTQRSREIGVRMALGAQRHTILGMVVGEGLVMALVGVVAGLAIAFWATRLLGSLLFGISATDLATYVTTSLLLIGTAVAASYLPARRATRVSPMTAFGRD